MTDTNTEKTAIIDRSYHWRKIDSDTPLGIKMQLINKQYGVAMYAILGSTNKWFTHWAPLPTFEKN